MICSERDFLLCGMLVLHLVRNQNREPPVSHHCVVKISRRCHRIAVEILPSTGTNHAAHKSNFCLDGALVQCFFDNHILFSSIFL